MADIILQEINSRTRFESCSNLSSDDIKNYHPDTNDGSNNSTHNAFHEKIPFWKPACTRWSYIMTLILIHLLLIIMNEIFGRPALGPHPREEGLPIGFAEYNLNDELLPGKQRFGFIFLPTLITSLLSLMIQSLDIDVKVSEPLSSLARQNGATGDGSLCSDYLSINPFIGCFKAWKVRHWNVILSLASSFLTLLVFPLLAASYFQRLVAHRYDQAGNQIPFFPDNRDINYSSIKDCTSCDIVIATSPGIVGATTFFLLLNASILGTLLWRCEAMTTGVYHNPNSIVGIMRLTKHPRFRSIWLEFPTWVTVDSMHRKLANQKFIFIYHQDEVYSDGWIDIFGVTKSETDSKTTSDFREEDLTRPIRSKGLSGSLKIWQWKKRLPWAIQPLVGYTIIAFYWIFQFAIRGQLIDLQLTFTEKRTICTLWAIIIKYYCSVLNIECRFIEAFRPRSMDVTKDTMEGNIFEEHWRKAAPMIETDFITTTPFVDTFRFLKMNLWTLATISALPVFFELWTIVFATNTTGIFPPDEEMSELMDELVEAQLPLWIYIIAMLGPLMLTYLIMTMTLDSSSPYNFTLPRHPSSLAARISYIYSSKGLSNPNSNKAVGTLVDNGVMGLGWYECSGKERQLRFDGPQNCVEIFKPWK